MADENLIKYIKIAERFENVSLDQQKIINAYHDGYQRIMSAVNLVIPLEFDRDVKAINAVTQDIIDQMKFNENSML